VKYAGILNSASPPCAHELHFNNTLIFQNSISIKLIASLNFLYHETLLDLAEELHKFGGYMKG
jgi:hypothetical protein